MQIKNVDVTRDSMTTKMENEQSPIQTGKSQKISDTSTDVKPTSVSVFSLTGKRLTKKFQLIWLDPNIGQNEQIKSAIKRLEEIVSCILSTNDYDECKQWLMNYRDKKRIFFIVSNKYGKQLVPDVHSLPSIIAIYVYCTNRKIHTKWTESYPKVRSVASDTNKLIEKLLMDLRNPRRIKNLESSVLGKTTSSKNAELCFEKKNLVKNEDIQEGAY